jgi:hypothetical protein
MPGQAVDRAVKQPVGYEFVEPGDDERELPAFSDQVSFDFLHDASLRNDVLLKIL